tara:strand:+ start:93 stop:371 length:279 start_codon:yes stop_codon:yes gene_type:complete
MSHQITILLFPTTGDPKAVIIPLGKTDPPLLEALQSLVCGYIEEVPHHLTHGLPEGKILIVNQEGLLHNLPSNPHITGIVGNGLLMNDQDLP